MRIYAYDTYLCNTSATAIVVAEGPHEAAAMLRDSQHEAGYDDPIDANCMVRLDELPHGTVKLFGD